MNHNKQAMYKKLLRTMSIPQFQTNKKSKSLVAKSSYLEKKMKKRL